MPPRRVVWLCFRLYVDALAEKLIYLIEHPEIWPKMGRASRTYVEANYDINKLNGRLVEIYQRLLYG